MACPDSLYIRDHLCRFPNDISLLITQYLCHDLLAYILSLLLFFPGGNSHKDQGDIASLNIPCHGWTEYRHDIREKMPLWNKDPLSSLLVLIQQTFNTLRPRQNGRHVSDDIFKCIFLNENVWISLKIWLNSVLRFKLIIFQQWFR